MMVYELTLRLATALVVGTVIGIERQWRHKMAGLRTNVLVAVGAAVFCLIAALSDHEASPTRIAAQIASGISCLGAGIILRDGLNVRGLNTAATLWCAAAAGARAGSGFFLPTLAASLVMLGTNLFLRQLMSKLEVFEQISLRQQVYYEVQVICEGDVAPHIRILVSTAVRESRLVLQSLRSALLNTGRQCQIVATLTPAERSDREAEDLIARLGTDEGVTSVAWQCTADPSQRPDTLRLTPMGWSAYRL